MTSLDLSHALPANLFRRHPRSPKGYLQPSVKELGKGLQTITKTVLLALESFDLTIKGLEMIKPRLIDKLAEKLKYVPEERIAPPNPNIAGPAVEALRFAANEPDLR